MPLMGHVATTFKHCNFHANQPRGGTHHEFFASTFLLFAPLLWTNFAWRKCEKTHFVMKDGDFATTLTRSHFSFGDPTNLKMAATDWTVAHGLKAGYAED
ncbi:hypothetical protein SUGI_0220020 [Cryptomeria japonica]|nr:hypothetical protein SUGI_0220020 [Cryptomeria japonica]